jgi:tetratricopeptide (TPR) repeat protein
MRYDDGIRYPEMTDDREEIIRQLRLHCPEYELPGAVATEEFIRNVVHFGNDPDGYEEFQLNDDEIRSVLDCLPEYLKVRPMSKETISAINDLAIRAVLDSDLEDSLFGQCKDADDFSMRAAAKERLGFYEEALRDYSTAYAMGSDDNWLLIDMAQIYMKLGQMSEVHKYALLCFEKSKDICIEDFSRLQDILMLVFLFGECGDLKMTVKAMLRFMECLNELMPYISIKSGGEIRIKKGNDEFSTGLIFMETFLLFIKESEDKPGQDTESRMMLEKLKNEVVLFRKRLFYDLQAIH